MIESLEDFSFTQGISLSHVQILDALKQHLSQCQTSKANRQGIFHAEEMRCGHKCCML